MRNSVNEDLEIQSSKSCIKSGRKHVIIIILIANISNIIAGLSFAWSSPILVKLGGVQDNPLGDPISSDQSDLVGSLFYIGACIGPLSIIWTLEKLGRKNTVIILGVLYFVGYTLLAFSQDIRLYYICRVLLGLTVGGIVCTIPVYSSEILPAKIRGSLMSLSNTSIQGGSLLAYILGPYLSITMFNSFIAIISLIFMICFFIFCPESPYFVISVKGKEKAGQLLQNLRKNDFSEELDEIELSLNEQSDKSYLAIFKTKHSIKAFFLGTLILLAQQFTGINVIIGYSQLIFLKTDVNFSSEKCAIIVGCFQFASSFIVPLYSEKFPRKLMLEFSLFGLTLCNFIISVYFWLWDDMKVVNWLPLLTLAFFVLFDNCGDGALPWVFLGELYPVNIKSTGTALSTSIFYLFQFFITFIFNKLEFKFMFSGFTLCCILSIIFVHYSIPETKGKTLREIQKTLEKDGILK